MIILGSFWDHFGIVLDHFWITLGSSWAQRRARCSLVVRGYTVNSSFLRRNHPINETTQVMFLNINRKITSVQAGSKAPKPLVCRTLQFHGYPIITGSPRTEPGTGNRTVLEPEPAEPAIDTEPDEPEPRFGSMSFCFVLYPKRNAKCLIRLMRNV